MVTFESEYCQNLCLQSSPNLCNELDQNCGDVGAVAQIQSDPGFQLTCRLALTSQGVGQDTI